MKIRRADIEKDALAIMDGARDFASRLDFKDFLPKSDDEFIAAVGRVADHPSVEIMVAEHQDRIVGGVGMVYGPHLWNQGIVTADELFFWSSPDAPPATALLLLRAVRRRAKEQGAGMITFKALTSSPIGIESVYGRLGLRKVETSFVGIL